MQTTLPCPNCGLLNPMDTHFCTACGVAIVALCSYCHATVDPNRRFCHNCGSALPGGMRQIIPAVQEPRTVGSISTSLCENCWSEAPTKYVELHQNIGLLVIRLHKSVKGNLCKACIRKYFWQFTTTTFFFGWWGVISFFVTLFILPNNLIRYLSSLGLPEPSYW